MHDVLNAVYQQLHHIPAVVMGIPLTPLHVLHRTHSTPLKSSLVAVVRAHNEQLGLKISSYGVRTASSTGGVRQSTWRYAWPSWESILMWFSPPGSANPFSCATLSWWLAA